LLVFAKLRGCLGVGSTELAETLVQTVNKSDRHCDLRVYIYCNNAAKFRKAVRAVCVPGIGYSCRHRYRSIYSNIHATYFNAG